VSDLNELLAVFARAPELGRVKTRLSPPLTADEALHLHRALVEDTLAQLDRVQRPGLSRVLLLSRPLIHPTDLDIPRGWTVGIQSGGDLGERLASVFHNSFRRGARKVLILGSDSPTLPLEVIHDALDGLDRVDIVVGPSTDGGYYLIGAKIFLPELFRGIPWGSGEVFTQTRKTLEVLGIRYELLVPWYDVDRAPDIEKIRQEIRYLERSHPELVPRRVLAALPAPTDAEYSLGPEFD
jgi:uncharacterized protein